MVSTVTSSTINSANTALGVLAIVQYVLWQTSILLGANKTNRVPEDKMLGLNEPLAPGSQSQSDGTTVAQTDDANSRWRRIRDNQAESFWQASFVFYIAYFFTYSLGLRVGGILGSADPQPTFVALTVFIWIYIVNRVLFAIAYYNALQPWRTVFWLAAQVSVFSAIIIIAYALITWPLPTIE
jgi:hypothetical protein